MIKSIGLFGNSIADIKEKISSLKETINEKGILGGINHFFSKSPIDTDALKEYNELLENGVDPTKAQEQATKGVNKATRELIVSKKGLKFTEEELGATIDQMTLKMRLQQVGIKALKMALNTISYMVVFSLISKAISGISTHINNLIHTSEKAREKSTELTNTWEEENSSIDDSISKYKELKEKLNSTSLSTEDVKSAKKDLLTVQEELCKKYGQESLKLDLVNGKYDEQIKKLDELSKKKALEYVNKNYSSVKEDREYLNEKINIKDNFSIDSDDKEYKDIEKNLKKYKNLYLRVKKIHDNGSITFDKLESNGTREQVYQQLNSLMEDLSYNFGESSEVVNKLKETISDTLKNDSDLDTKKIEEAKNNIKQYAKAEILSKDSTRKLYIEATDSVEKYQEALASGKGVESAKKNLDKVKNKVKDINKTVSGGKAVFNDLFKTINQGSKKITETSTPTDTLTQEEKKYNKALKKYQEAYDKLNTDPKIRKYVATGNEALNEERKKISSKEYGLQDYKDALEDKYVNGGTSYVQTQFGNINMDKRQIIKWSKELKETYKDELQSWDYNPEIGGIDTVFGGSMRVGEDFDGKGAEIAFSPILQTEDGAVFLSQQNVSDYLNAIYSEAAKDGKISEKEILELDQDPEKIGFKVGEHYVSGIIAGMDSGINYGENGNGNKASLYGKLMHFSGLYGAYNLADNPFVDDNSLADNYKKQLKKYKKVKEEYEKALNQKKDSDFKSGWKDLDNVDSKSKMKNTKKDLLSLAEAGKLTVKTFNKTKGAKTWLKSIGLDADEAVKKINGLVDSSKRLNSLKTGISQIQTAYADKRDNGVAGADTLSSMEAEFGNLKSWDKYEKTLGSTTSKLKDCQEAQNELATEYINSNNFLDGIVDKTGKVDKATKQYYVSQLKDLGIKNAEEIVNEKIKEQKIDLAIANFDATTATNDEINGLIKETTQLGGNSDALKKYVFYKNLANKNNLSTSESIKNLIALAKQCKITGKTIQQLEILQMKKEIFNQVLNETPTTNEGVLQRQSRLEDLSNDINTTQTKLSKANTKISLSDITGKGKGVNGIKSPKSSSSKNKSSSTKQEIDWIERRITTLTNVISRYNAEKENLFTVKSKNKNLNKQLKETTKLINTYSGAYYKYIAKANSVKLSGSLKKLVRNGKITGSYKDLIKKYGEKTANKIQSYENYYDKAQSARQNRADAIKQRRELKIEKNQNYVDKYNADATYNELLASDTHYIAKIRNGYINKEIKATKKSYAYQIKIAKLNKDVTEQKRLQAELDQKINDFNKTKFDNVAKDYERKLKMIEYSMTAIDNEVENIEASGSTVDKSYYLDKKKLVSERAELLKKEKSDLEKYIKNITYGTDEYYEALSTIKDIDSEISKCTKSQYELNSAIKQLNIDKFEKLQKKLGRISTENDFLVGLFEHEDSVDSDTGLITDAGKGRLWAYTSDLYVSQEKTDRDKKELDRLNKLKAEGKYGINSGEFSSLEELEERIDAVYDTWQNDISQTYEYEKKIVDEMKSYYEKQIDILQDLIDKKKEALSAEKD